jgi:alpha-tubulin suppressor-like RCC1 family protein
MRVRTRAALTLALGAACASGCVQVISLGSDLRVDGVVTDVPPASDVKPISETGTPPEDTPGDHADAAPEVARDVFDASLDASPDVPDNVPFDAPVEVSLDAPADVFDGGMDVLPDLAPPPPDAVDVAPPPPDLDIAPTLSGPIRSLALGGRHSCGIFSGSVVGCWGANDYGQFGNRTTTSSAIPLVTRDLPPVVSLSTGKDHNCAIDSSAHVWCWGRADNGRIFTVSPSARPTPFDTGVLADSVAAGGTHTCVVRTGQVSCAGANDQGQLGDRTTSDRNAPVAVADVGAVREVVLGDQFSCALRMDSTVWCWGRNAEGQLGRGSLSPIGAPAVVPGLAGVTRIFVGARHACAIVGATVSCWGDNSAGQLGDGTTTTRPSPTVIPGWAFATLLALGDDFTCASSNESALCAGANDRGQLGDGTTTARTTPTIAMSVVGFPRTSLSGVRAGARHACTQVSDGSTWCWGDGVNGPGTMSAFPRVIWR